MGKQTKLKQNLSLLYTGGWFGRFCSTPTQQEAQNTTLIVVHTRPQKKCNSCVSDPPSWEPHGMRTATNGTNGDNMSCKQLQIYLAK